MVIRFVSGLNKGGFPLSPTLRQVQGRSPEALRQDGRHTRPDDLASSVLQSSRFSAALGFSRLHGHLFLNVFLPLPLAASSSPFPPCTVACQMPGFTFRSPGTEAKASGQVTKTTSERSTPGLYRLSRHAALPKVSPACTELSQGLQVGLHKDPDRQASRLLFVLA